MLDSITTVAPPVADEHLRVIPARRLQRTQRLHFLLCNVLPLLGTFLGVAIIPFRSPTWVDAIAFSIMWLFVSGLGVSVGLHRYFSHRSFVSPTWLTAVLGIAGSMAAQGPLLYWVAIHRCHHENSDSTGDPHSPWTTDRGLAANLRAFFHGHCGWVVYHDVPSPKRYVPDLLDSPLLRWLNSWYWAWVTLGIVVPGVLGGLLSPSSFSVLTALLWGGFVRIVLTNHITWSVNSVCHRFGTHAWDTGDQSRNNGIVALLSFGEGWHNNHHALPTSAQFGRRWWQLDPGWWMVRGLEVCGFATQVRRPRNDESGVRASREHAQ